MNKKILLSLGMLAFVGAAVVGGTGAFFSDTETSTGNVFTAGSVTVGIEGITHTYNGADANNAPIFDENGFSFTLDDLKPLDEGEIDYDLVNGANEAFICALVTETENNDNGVNDPETAAGDTDDGAGNGELGDFLNFKFGTQTGSLSAISGQWQTVGTTSANTTTSSGFSYCFGEFDGNNECVLGTTDDDNKAQTDSLTADVQFYAVQTRNNEDFDCSTLPTDGNGGDDRPAVGAVAFAYVAPEPASCDITVNDDTNGSDDASTIQGGVDAASDNDTICVDGGTYTEDVIVNKDVTILGLNDPKGANKATLNGQMNITVGGVTVSGLEFTNPDGKFALVVKNVDSTEISDNSFVDIGTSVSTGGVQAIYFEGTSGATGASGLTITGNMIDGVGSPSLSQTDGGSSAKGIYIGDSNDNGTISGVVITDNMISDVKASNDTFANGGRGAYGILLNHGVNATGLVDGSVIMNNTISDVAGYWARGVGLETNTPNTSVTRNDISNIVDNLPAGGGSDGVHFEGNPGGSSTVVNENNLASTVDFGVAIHPANTPITVDAEDNWWGDTNPSDDVNENSGTIDFDPFETSAYPTN